MLVVSPQNTCPSPTPVSANMTLFTNRVFADVIRKIAIRMCPKSNMTGVLIKREETQMYVWGRQNEEIWEE
jgi:hypothetical protein